MKAAVILEKNGTRMTLPFEPGKLLSEVLGQNGEVLDMPCSGNGSCGGCLVYVDGQKLRACQTPAKAGMHVQLIGHSDIKGIGVPDIAAPTKPMFKRFGVAFDIGTTTVYASLLDANGLVETVIRKNPQTKYGADVISRIEKALSGNQTELADCIRSTLNEMISELCAHKGILACDIDAAVAVGNTAMLYLLTQHNPYALSHAPFEADRLFDESLSALALDIAIAPDAQVYIPPCISAFIGADFTAAAIASGILDRYKTALLADIGTNGEIALWHNGMLTCCSTAAGPAFEGAGITCGTYGIDGAIDKAWLDNGQIQTSTIGGKAAVGICGSGIIDLLTAMLKAGIIDRTGAFKTGIDAVVLQNEIYVNISDVRKIQLAKGAVRAGIETLITHTGIKEEEIQALFISGGFGSFINLANAVAIGLIPTALLNRSKTIGNAAQTGAINILCNRSLCSASQLLAKRVNVVGLDANPVFLDNYIRYMHF